MLHHILYVLAPAQIERIKIVFHRLGAEPLPGRQQTMDAFQVRHHLLDKLVLNVHLISDLDAITPHLRQNPVDLLIYDERAGGIDARAALAKIRDDVVAFAALWGPDFFFPMSRVVAILEREENDAQRAFELGRVQVRDVCVAPKNTAAVLRWLKRVLTQGIIRNKRAGMALSGGGLEGFLFQTGVLHALHKAIAGRPLRQMDVYSGISSGSICAALMAGNVPTAEVIRAMHGRSDILPPLTGAMLFDVATKSIATRLLKESVTWAGLDPNKWTRKLFQSIPTGLFKGEAMKNYFKHAIEAYGQLDAFRQDGEHGPELYIGATDQDTYEHVTFGKGAWSGIPISEALRASCALPPFFTPAQVGGRWFIDGQVTKTVNLELLVERGCGLIFIIDPMKPLATLMPGSVDERGGLYAIIQTIKALVHTRFQQTLTHLTERYPDVDFIVFQPDEEAAHLMAGSPMRYRIRTQIVASAYRHTLRQLRERHHIYSAKLARFGFELREPQALMELERTGNDLLNAVA